MSNTKKDDESSLTPTLLDDTYREVVEKLRRMKKPMTNTTNDGDRSAYEELLNANKDGYTCEKITTTRIGGNNNDYIQETVIERSVLLGNGVQTTTKHIVKRCDKQGHVELEMQESSHVTEHTTPTNASNTSNLSRDATRDNFENPNASNTSNLGRDATRDNFENPNDFLSSTLKEPVAENVAPTARKPKNAEPSKNVTNSTKASKTSENRKKPTQFPSEKTSPRRLPYYKDEEENLNDQSMPTPPTTPVSFEDTETDGTDEDEHEHEPNCPCYCGYNGNNLAQQMNIYLHPQDQAVYNELIGQQDQNANRQRVDHYLVGEELSDISEPSYPSFTSNQESESSSRNQVGNVSDIEPIRQAYPDATQSTTNFAPDSAQPSVTQVSSGLRYNSDHIDDTSAPLYHSFSTSSLETREKPNTDNERSIHSLPSRDQTYPSEVIENITPPSSPPSSPIRSVENNQNKRDIASQTSALIDSLPPLSSTKAVAPGTNLEAENIENKSQPAYPGSLSHESTLPNNESYPSERIADGSAPAANVNESARRSTRTQTYPHEVLDNVSAPLYTTAEESNNKSTPSERIADVSAPTASENESSRRSTRTQTYPHEVLDNVSAPLYQTAAENLDEKENSKSYPSERIADTSAPPAYANESSRRSTRTQTYPSENIDDVSAPSYQTANQVASESTRQSYRQDNQADIPERISIRKQSVTFTSSTQSNRDSILTRRSSSNATREAKQRKREQAMNETLPSENIGDITPPQFHSTPTSSPRTSVVIQNQSENLAEISEPLYPASSIAREEPLDYSAKRGNKVETSDARQPLQTSQSKKEDIQNISAPTNHSVKDTQRTSDKGDPSEQIADISPPLQEKTDDNGSGSPRREAEDFRNITEPSYKSIEDTNKTADTSQRSSTIPTEEVIQNVTEPTYHSLDSTQRTNDNSRPIEQTAVTSAPLSDKTNDSSKSPPRMEEDIQNITAPTYESLDSTNKTADPSQRPPSIDTEEIIQNVTEPAYHSLDSTQRTNDNKRPIEETAVTSAPLSEKTNDSSKSSPRTEEDIQNITEPICESIDSTNKTAERTKQTQTSFEVQVIQRTNDNSQPIEQIADVSAPLIDKIDESSKSSPRTEEDIQNITAPTYESIDSTNKTADPSQRAPSIHTEEEIQNVTEPTYHSLDSTQRTSDNSRPIEQISDIPTPLDDSSKSPPRMEEDIQNITEPFYESIDATRETDEQSQLPQTTHTEEVLQNVTEPTYQSLDSTQRTNDEQIADISAPFDDKTDKDNMLETPRETSAQPEENIEHITEPTYHSSDDESKTKAPTTKVVTPTSATINEQQNRSLPAEENLQNISEPTYHSISSNNNTKPSEQIADTSAPPLFDSLPNQTDTTEENIQNVTEPTYQSINSTPNNAEQPASSLPKEPSNQEIAEIIIPDDLDRKVVVVLKDLGTSQQSTQENTETVASTESISKKLQVPPRPARRSKPDSGSSTPTFVDSTSSQRTDFSKQSPYSSEVIEANRFYDSSVTDNSRPQAQPAQNVANVMPQQPEDQSNNQPVQPNPPQSANQRRPEADTSTPPHSTTSRNSTSTQPDSSRQRLPYSSEATSLTSGQPPIAKTSTSSTYSSELLVSAPQYITSTPIQPQPTPTPNQSGAPPINNIPPTPAPAKHRRKSAKDSSTPTYISSSNAQPTSSTYSSEAIQKVSATSNGPQSTSDQQPTNSSQVLYRNKTQTKASSSSNESDHWPPTRAPPQSTFSAELVPRPSTSYDTAPMTSTQRTIVIMTQPTPSPTQVHPQVSFGSLNDALDNADQLLNQLIIPRHFDQEITWDTLERRSILRQTDQRITIDGANRLPIPRHFDQELPIESSPESRQKRVCTYTPSIPNNQRVQLDNNGSRARTRRNNSPHRESERQRLMQRMRQMAKFDDCVKRCQEKK